MPAPSVADPSTRPLSEVARHLVVPPRITDSLWFDVDERCREFGDAFDAWQDGLGQVALGLTEDGQFAATVGGVTLSIPRQVAKTFIVMRIVVAICTLFPDVTVVWTAHRTRTATMTFQKMKAYVLRPAARKYLRPGSNQGTAIRDANGEQEIPFANGSRILFGAREQGFGRGFDEVDIEVFDEAQILTEKALEDMVPAANQSRFPHGALLFFMGTPPRPNDPGEAFTVRRTKALSGSSVDLVYVECSADEGADPDDREQWAKANPSYPVHTPEQSILRMREILGDDESFMREALGVWDPTKSAQVIDPTTWALIADQESVPAERFALAVDVSPDRSTASVGFAGQRSDGDWHVELDETRHGVGWLVPYVAARCERNDIRAVVVDGASAAASIVDDLGKRKIKVTTTGVRDMAAACGSFYDGAMEGWLHHIDQPQLNAALGVARKRSLLGGEAWAWNRKSAASDITPLVACTLALWGAQSSVVKKPVKKRTNGREAVLL